MDDLFASEKIATIRATKVIAEIKVCGALTLTVTEFMDFKKPTEEQIKNLRDTLCIDVKILE